jgi:hypothetical protein
MYNNNNRLVDIFSEIEDTIVDGRRIKWHNGEVVLNDEINFIIVNGSITLEMDADITNLITEDVKDTLLPNEKKKEVELQSMQSMINTIMLDPTNIEQQSEIEQMQSIINTMMLGGM